MERDTRRWPLRADGERGYGFHTPITMEHRQALRHRVFWPVGLEGSRGRDAGLISNICRDGSFIRSAADLELGTCIDVRIPRFRHDEFPLSLTALVVHREGRGFGLMFRDHDEEVDSIIERLSRLPPPTGRDPPGNF